MSFLILIALVLFLPLISDGQNFSVHLSPPHVEKLNAIKDGRKRLKKYYLYFEKDSLRQVKKESKYYTGILVDNWRIQKFRQKFDRKYSAEDRENFEKWTHLISDSTASDSMKTVAWNHLKSFLPRSTKFKTLTSYRTSAEAFTTNAGDIPKLNPAKLIPSLFGGADRMLPDNMEGINQPISLIEQGDWGLHGQKFKHFTDSSYHRELRQDVRKKAFDYLTDNNDKIQSAQHKVTKLLARYKDFSNSNDLGHAVKRSSLSGASVFERLVPGGNFNVISTKPISLDLSPTLGYRLTTGFFIGAGMSYRYTLQEADSSHRHGHISVEQVGFKVLANVDLGRSFFASGEWERTAHNFSTREVRKHVANNFFAGMGKRVLIHPKLYLNLAVMYNLNYTDKNSTYPGRLRVRAGFQLSELALRKKKTRYDPNR